MSFEPLVPVLFLVAFFLNARAVFKLLLDWKGMHTTVAFVRDAYRRLGELPTEEALEREPAAPVFLHLVAAYQEPDIAGTVKALVGSRYPHGSLHVVVITKEEEEGSPHPQMGVTTGELVRRLRETLPPYQQKRLAHLVMPGPGRKAHQLNWALRPEALAHVLGDGVDPARVFVGVSDADSIPDLDTYRWIASRELAGPGASAYQGITLSLANYDRQSIRGKICAIQQSSIFIRVSIARLINEVKRVRFFAALAARAPRLAGLVRPAFELCFRRSQICLGHNQFVRLDTLVSVGGFPTRGATEDSTLGYALGARGILIQATPMVELTDLPESSEKVIRQNARWYLGVLDDVPFLRRVLRESPTPFNLAQLVRHVGNKVVEWPIAALVYPVTGWLGWYLAYTYRAQHPVLFYLGVGAPTLSLLLTVWVGGIVTQTLIEDLHPYLPRRVDLRRKNLKEKFLGTFRCQTYWLLATRAAWRVLWSIWRTGRYEAAKTDRVSGRHASMPRYARSPARGETGGDS
jgi:cellulose synthase/poly-beta-1,6-N-acetylglucosamine synthase-like glycosyltransferase